MILTEQRAVVCADVNDEFAGLERHNFLRARHDVGERLDHRGADAGFIPVFAVEQIVVVGVLELK